MPNLPEGATPPGNIATYAAPGKATITYTYDKQGQLLSAISNTNSYSYTYDNVGNILTASDGTNTTSYVYDSANQLIRENNKAAGKTWVWEYDNAGNIQSKTEYAYTTGTLGTAIDTVTYGYGDADWKDLLTSYDGKTVTSDTIGNMLSDGTWDYTWEHGRELASMSNGSTPWTFTYDANGMRTKRVSGGTTYSYVYNGSTLSQMTVAGDTLYFVYDASGTPTAVVFNGTTYYYQTNLQGDVVALLNANGEKVVEYTYDAWGRVLSRRGSLASTLGSRNPLRYRGYVYDVEIGFYYLQSRYYDPEIGRFINADVFTSTGQGMLGNNMFAYCGNNPVNYSDPTGELGLVGLGIIISGVIGGVVAAATTSASGGSVAEIIVSGLIGAGTASATAAVAASGLTLATVAWVSAGIGAAGEMLSQGTEYLFHKNDEDYEYDWVEGATKVLYSSGMNAIGGSVSKGINSVFASTDPGGTFVSGVASSGLGGLDFGIRQFISAIID